MVAEDRKGDKGPRCESLVIATAAAAAVPYHSTYPPSGWSWQIFYADHNWPFKLATRARRLIKQFFFVEQQLNI
jgi:hypothetical protein